MRNMLDMLADRGIDGATARSKLPDWWDDDLASVPANLATAEGHLSQAFGIPIAEFKKVHRMTACPYCREVFLSVSSFPRFKPSGSLYAVACGACGIRGPIVAAECLREARPLAESKWAAFLGAVRLKGVDR
jgi:hypothetical protein